MLMFQTGVLFIATMQSPPSRWTVDVNVMVLRLPDGSPSTTAPYVDATSGTLPIDADGDFAFAGEDAGSSLATSLDTSDVIEIFEEVNRLYSDSRVTWRPNVTMVGPAAACAEGERAGVVGKYKVRSHDYFVKYFGTVNKVITKEGREERPINIGFLPPQDAFKPGAFNLLYIKYLGVSSQGVVTTTPDWLHAPNGASVATVGQWSNKFTSTPILRPNLLACGSGEWGGVSNCGIGLAYTTAHELGHLCGLGHTDAPSIMSGGGQSEANSRFSAAQTAAITAWFESSAVPMRYYNDIVYEDAAARLGMVPLGAADTGSVRCGRGPPIAPSSPAPPPLPPAPLSACTTYRRQAGAAISGGNVNSPSWPDGRVYYSASACSECEIACSSLTDCIAFVDNHQASPPYCVLKKIADWYPKSSKDTYTCQPHRARHRASYRRLFHHQPRRHQQRRHPSLAMRRPPTPSWQAARHTARTAFLALPTARDASRCAVS